MEKSNKSNDKQIDSETYMPGEISFMPNTPDPTFKTMIQAAQETKRSVLMERRNKQMMESVDKSEPEESGSNELNIPVNMGDLDDDDDDNDDDGDGDNLCGIKDEEESETITECILKYHKVLEDIKQFKLDEKKMATEHLEMSKRVQAWHENLRPLLDEEEKRGTEYDEYEYGTRVLNRFSKVGEQITFSELFGGMVKEEVARYFSSILMLTNTGNLKILQPTNGEKAIQLLKKERHHEELQANVGNQVNKE